MKRTEYRDAVRNYEDALPSAGKSAKTIKSYSIILRKFGEYISGREGEAEITSADIIRWRASLFSEHVSNNSIKQYLSVLHGFFNWCMRMHYIDKNPVDAKEIPGASDIDYNLLNMDEINELLWSNKKSKTPHTIRNRAIVVLLLQTGIRNSELRSLRVSDLDFENSRITVQHGKGDKRRTTCFPALSQEAVKNYLSCGIRPASCKDADYLFGTDAKQEFGKRQCGEEWHQLSSESLLGIVNRYTERVCGHKVGVHTLRHAAASVWDDRGVPMRDIQNALGHSSISTTERVYVKVLNTARAANTITLALNK